MGLRAPDGVRCLTLFPAPTRSRRSGRAPCSPRCEALGPGTDGEDQGCRDSSTAGSPPSFGHAPLARLLPRRLPGRRALPLLPRAGIGVLANLAVTMPRASRRDRVKVAKQVMQLQPHDVRVLPVAAPLARGTARLGRGRRPRAPRGRAGAPPRRHPASSHIGNRGAGRGHDRAVRLHAAAVAGVQLNRWLSGAVRETKTELAIQTVSPEDGFRKLLRALDHNDPIALVVDGDIYAHGVNVEFFGRTYHFPPVPACSRSAPARAHRVRLLRGASRPASSAW